MTTARQAVDMLNWLEGSRLTDEQRWALVARFVPEPRRTPARETVAQRLTTRGSRAALAYRLRAAVVTMTSRYGDARANASYAHSRYLDTYDAGNKAEQERWERATRRRFRCVQRLATALADLGGAS